MKYILPAGGGHPADAETKETVGPGDRWRTDHQHPSVPFDASVTAGTAIQEVRS